ncbi:MAG: MoxR-like ATPase [Gammaproteobacteria bacterium]|jgi:MoxR-like ATPase
MDIEHAENSANAADTLVATPNNTGTTAGTAGQSAPISSTASAGPPAANPAIGAELADEIGKVLVGQKAMVTRLVIGLLCGGHVLLEGMPGLAKTLTVRALASAIDTGFSRIQFTPDMLPADVVGTEVFNPNEGTYSVKTGPIFSNLVLADEINRAPAKVQSALLEVMEERQVTIGGQTFKMQEPFLVLATQNPVEQEGTYPLPEAQVDRFMMKVHVPYPSRDEEQRILERMTTGQALPAVRKVATPEEIAAAKKQIHNVFADDKVRDYIVDLIRATRPENAQGGPIEGLLDHGASPRAAIWLMLGAKANAFLQGRNYVTPHDAKSLAPDVLRHRVGLSYEAEAQGMSADDVVQRVLDSVLVP